MPLITLLTDFGVVDPSVGACRGVVNAIAPGVDLADISHNIPPYDITGHLGTWIPQAWRA